LSIKRRHFVLNSLLALSGLILVTPIVTLLDRFRRHLPTTKRSKELTLPAVDGVHLLDNFILVKNGDQVRLFSRACTHLGCQLELDDKLNLLCPCHGSKFNHQGEVERGPAIRSLTEFRISFSAENSNQLVVGDAI